MSFDRHVLFRGDLPDWSSSALPLRPLSIAPRAKIEDSDCPYLVDFANSYVGGGTLTGVLSLLLKFRESIKAERTDLRWGRRVCRKKSSLPLGQNVSLPCKVALLAE